MISVSISVIQMYFFSLLVQQMMFGEWLEMVLYVAGSILSLILVALSFISYRRSGLKKLLYAVIAFSLFFVFLFYEALEHFYSLDNVFTDIVIPLSGLAIVLFFFLAVIKKS